VYKRILIVFSTLFVMTSLFYIGHKTYNKVYTDAYRAGIVLGYRNGLKAGQIIMFNYLTHENKDFLCIPRKDILEAETSKETNKGGSKING